MPPGPMLFWAIQESKGGAQGPASRRAGESGSRNFWRDGAKNICDRFLYRPEKEDRASLLGPFSN
jgi:hypothetical protein